MSRTNGRYRFCGSSIIISQRLSFVNRFFKSFLDFFQLFSIDFRSLRYLSVALATLNILPLCSPFVKCEFRQSVYLLYLAFVYCAQHGVGASKNEALGVPRAYLVRLLSDYIEQIHSLLFEQGAAKRSKNGDGEFRACGHDPGLRPKTPRPF